MMRDWTVAISSPWRETCFEALLVTMRAKSFFRSRQVALLLCKFLVIIATALIVHQHCPQAAAKDFLWSRQAGGTGIDAGRSIVVDSAGNSYVAGSFQGVADFGALRITSEG